MVNVINNTGCVQNSAQTNKTDNRVNERERSSETRGSSVKSDSVEISQDALNLSDANKAADDTRAFLENNTGHTLSSGGKQLNSLV